MEATCSCTHRISAKQRPNTSTPGFPSISGEEIGATPTRDRGGATVRWGQSSGRSGVIAVRSSPPTRGWNTHPWVLMTPVRNHGVTSFCDRLVVQMERSRLRSHRPRVAGMPDPFSPIVPRRLANRGHPYARESGRTFHRARVLTLLRCERLPRQMAPIRLVPSEGCSSPQLWLHERGRIASCRVPHARAGSAYRAAAQSPFVHLIQPTN